LVDLHGNSPFIAQHGTVDGIADVGLGCDVEALLVGGLESGGKGVAVSAIDEVDGAAAEAAAGESSSKATGEVAAVSTRKSISSQLHSKSSRSLAWPASMSWPKAMGSPANMAFACLADARVVGDDVAAAQVGVLRHERTWRLRAVERGRLAEIAKLRNLWTRTAWPSSDSRRRTPYSPVATECFTMELQTTIWVSARAPWFMGRCS
jgi:hypothetical protein